MLSQHTTQIKTVSRPLSSSNTGLKKIIHLRSLELICWSVVFLRVCTSSPASHGPRSALTVFMENSFNAFSSLSSPFDCHTLEETVFEA